MRLPVGTRVEIFEKDGFESEVGEVITYNGDTIYIRYKNASGGGIMKIPNPKVSIILTTKGNSLEKYKVKEKV